MKSPGFAPTSLAAALIALCAVSATAQSPSPAPAPAPKAQAAEKELAQAQAELARAAKRVAELSRGTAAAPAIRIDQRIARRPVVGVLLAPDAEAGVRIAGVTPEGAAAKKGLKSGDRLLKVDGKLVSGSNAEQRLASAHELLGSLDSKVPVAIGYARDGKHVQVMITPELDQRVFMWDEKGDVLSKFSGPVFIRRGDAGEYEVTADAIEIETAGVAPQIRTEIMRLGANGPCKDKPCDFPMLTEAFRWNGLNLASVDAQLGRYFGTDQGVLVLSAGEDLAGLQPGDVIRKVDGKAVATPREAMDALRAKPADSLVAVDYLRDRRTASAQIKVPKAMPLRIPAPPTPPTPPAPPAPASPPSAAGTPRLPSAPAAPVARTERHVFIIDGNGQTRTWVDDGEAALPSPPPPPEAPMPPGSPDAD